MNIKPGKWRMRNGKMAVVEYRTEAYTAWPWRGYLDKCKSGRNWKDDGKWSYFAEHEQDLIEPWIDNPEVKWSAMPAWANWVSMDSNGNWFLWEKKPVREEYSWQKDPNKPGCLGIIPRAYHPIFFGDWKDSITHRPPW